MLQGSAILLPWADEVPSIVHAWYLGNPTGASIADVLFGNRNPAGKLSLTFPQAEEHVPSFGHFHTENGKVRYLVYFLSRLRMAHISIQIRYAEDIFVVRSIYSSFEPAMLTGLHVGL